MNNINLEKKEHNGYVLVVDNPSFIEKTKNTLLVFLDDEQIERLRELLLPVWTNTPPTEPGRYAWCRTPNTETRIFYAAWDEDGMLRVDHPTISTCLLSVNDRILTGWWLALDCAVKQGVTTD